jgi:hypothetical protein
MAKKQDDNENIRRKLAADGGSQARKVEIIKLEKDFNSKLKYFNKIINSFYENDPDFYLQRHEFAALTELLSKDSVWTVNAPNFEYGKNQFVVLKFVVETQYQDLIRNNRIFVFHGIGRGEGVLGDLLIYGVHL